MTTRDLRFRTEEILSTLDRHIRPLSLVGTLALLSGCGALNSLVGGDCPDGLTYDGERCVALDAGTIDPNGSDGGHGPDATVDGGGTTDASDGGGGGGDAGNGDGGSADADLDGSGDGGDADDGSVFSCDPKLTLCNAQCVDLQTDPNHCGNCNIQCPTLLCAAGKCQGALDGHIVVIGHDFSGITSMSQRRVLGNASLLPPVTQIRVRSWEQWANPTAVTVTRGIISSAATAQGRTVVFTQLLLPSDVTATTDQNADVLLVNDQPNAPPATLGALGTSFAATVAAFTQAGGVVIVTDGGTSGQMVDLVKNAGLIDLAGETNVPFSTSLAVSAPADAIGLGVLSPYAAGQKTVHFASNEPSSGQVSWVVVDPTPDAGLAPVVIHKVVP
jgi:hypothetical protein